MSTLRMFEVVRIKNNLINKFNRYLRLYAHKRFMENSKVKKNESTEELYYRLGEKHTWDIVRRLKYEDILEEAKA